MKVNVYLNFAGNTEEAFNIYMGTMKGHFEHYIYLPRPGGPSSRCTRTTSIYRYAVAL